MIDLPDQVPGDAPPEHRFLAAVAPFVLARARRFARSTGREIADVFQEFTLRVLQTATRYDPDRSAPTTYASLVTGHACTALLDDATRRVEMKALGRALDAEEVPEQMAEEMPRSREPDPAAAAELAELVSVAVSALARLPVDQRQAIQAAFGLDPTATKRGRVAFDAGLAELKEILTPREE